MSLLEKLHRKYRIDASEPRSSDSDIAALVAFAQVHQLRIPDGYLDIVRVATELEIMVIDEGMHFRIWSADGVMELNEAYEVQHDMPGALAIGSDQSGKALVYVNGAQGWGIYRTPYAWLELSEAVFIAPSLLQFLEQGVGAEVVFEK